MRAAAFLPFLLFAFPGGCFDGIGGPSCAIAASPAAFTATWYDAGNVTALNDALARAGWVQPFGDAFALALNESVVLAATTKDGAVAGQRFTTLAVTDPRHNVTSLDEARAWLEPLLAPTMREAMSALGAAPKLSIYAGGRPTCEM